MRKYSELRYIFLLEENRKHNENLIFHILLFEYFRIWKNLFVLVLIVSYDFCNLRIIFLIIDKLKYMKKIFLTTTILIALINFCFAQESEEIQGENKKIKPPSRVGGSLWNMFEIKTSELIYDGWASEIFYHQTIEQNTFISFGAVYIPLHPIIEHNITGSGIFFLGINYRSDLIEATIFPFYSFVGLEANLSIYRENTNNEKTKTKYSRHLFLNIGASIPLYKKFNLEINTRFMRLFPLNFTGVNLGISYSIP